MATTYLHRTTTSTGSNTTATFSGWVKRATTGTRHVVWAGWESSTERMVCGFESSDRLQMQIYTGGTAHDIETNRLFRDVGAWYHLVFQFDTSNASEPDRFKMWVNGIQETSFNIDDTITQDIEMKMWGSTSQETIVGARKNSGYEHYFDGEMSNIHIIDGTVYAPTEFGETDSTSGIWKFKNPTGLTYGTNGTFLLDNGAVTTDSSANSNNYSTGGTLTATKDNPSNNFSTWNPLNYSGTASYGIAYSDGSTTITPTSPDANGSRPWSASTLGMPAKGKWFAEFKLIEGDGVTQIGIGSSDIVPNRLYNNTAYGATTEAVIWQPYAGSIIYNNGDLTTGLTAASTGDIIGIAVDCDNEKMYCYLNGSLLNSGGESYTSKVTGSQILYLVGDNTTSGYDEVQANFGNGYFSTTAVTSAGTSSSGDASVWEYDCPADYYGLNTKNIGTYG
jgi:hypothetical protein